MRALSTIDLHPANPKDLAWKTWTAIDPGAPAPYRTFSIYREKLTGTRFGIYYGRLFPSEWETLPNGQVETGLRGMTHNQNPVFVQWISAHSLFGHVAYCIRNGLPLPPDDLRARLPRWVGHLYRHHYGRSIPSDYLSNPNFGYFDGGFEPERDAGWVIDIET